MNGIDLVEVRHQLHQLAEPSGCEQQTRQLILNQLKTAHPSHIHLFEDSNNVLALFDSDSPGPTILLRGDFDAVRVDETLNLPYASLLDGVSHKCGHDGHTAILLGVAHYLNQHPLTNGRVLLFFQAAEETGEGAAQLLHSGILNHYNPDKVFALHNIPGEPLGTVICRPDSFTCSVISCDINLQGRTSHAAEPLKSVCPYPAAKTIADKLLALNQYNIEKNDFFLATLVEFRVGEKAYGVAAGNGVLRFTLRSQNDQLLQDKRQQLVDITRDAVAAVPGIAYSIEWKEYFAASKNQPDSVALIQNAARTCGLPFQLKPTPFSWGEDFGLLTQQYNGALFGLGAGVQQPSLHHQLFDFPDELLPIGVRLFTQLLSDLLPMSR